MKGSLHDSEISDQDLTNEIPNSQDQVLDELPLIERVNKKLFFGGIAVFFLITGLSGLLFFLWSFQVETVKVPDQIKSDQVPLATFSPSPKAVLNRGEVKVEVLNGSGKTGAAKTAADKLKKSGYLVVRTGNAEKSNYKLTTIMTSKNAKLTDQLVQDDLKSQFPQATVSASLESEEVDVRIIVGVN